MKIAEFAEKLQEFIDNSKKEGIPLEDIISELEDIKDSIQEEVDDAEENPEEEDEEKESD